MPLPVLDAGGARSLNTVPSQMSGSHLPGRGMPTCTEPSPTVRAGGGSTARGRSPGCSWSSRPHDTAELVAQIEGLSSSAASMAAPSTGALAARSPSVLFATSASRSRLDPLRFCSSPSVLFAFPFVPFSKKLAGPDRGWSLELSLESAADPCVKKWFRA